MRDQTGIPDFAGGGRLCTGWARAWLALGAAFIFMSNAFAQDPIPGSLHTSPFPGFASGSGKIANLAVGASTDTAYAVAVQPDGKIVMAGTCSGPSNSDFCLVRLTPDGSLDSTFDGPGGSGNGKFLLPIGSGDDQAFKLALQPDGKIVLAGSCSNGANTDFCVARLNFDGSFDASFVGPGGGANGRFLLPITAGNEEARGLALQPDGKIVMVGYCVGVGGPAFCLARLNADGSLDDGFDGPGGGGNGRFLLTVGVNNDYGLAAAIQIDGKIVVAGYCHISSIFQLCVARLNANGTYDASFAAAGKVLFTVGSGGSDNAFAVTVQADGKILLAGICHNSSNYDFCLARLNPDGTLDSNFDGPTGIGNGKFLFPIGEGRDDLAEMALQPDGKIVVVGTCSTGANDYFCLARLNADGAFDTSFDGPGGADSGKVVLPMGAGFDRALAVALQSDGRILVAGTCLGDFCIARLNGGPYAAKNCSMDVDGDGAMIATRDGLMITRAMLGLTGSAVTNGITFAAHATRTSWTDIRNYLVGQCGMTIAP